MYTGTKPCIVYNESNSGYLSESNDVRRGKTEVLFSLLYFAMIWKDHSDHDNMVVVCVHVY